LKVFTIKGKKEISGRDDRGGGRGKKPGKVMGSWKGGETFLKFLQSAARENETGNRVRERSESLEGRPSGWDGAGGEQQGGGSQDKESPAGRGSRRKPGKMIGPGDSQTKTKNGAHYEENIKGLSGKREE